MNILLMGIEFATKQTAKTKLNSYWLTNARTAATSY